MAGLLDLLCGDGATDAHAVEDTLRRVEEVERRIELLLQTSDIGER